MSGRVLDTVFKKSPGTGARARDNCERSFTALPDNQFLNCPPSILAYIQHVYAFC